MILGSRNVENYFPEYHFVLEQEEREKVLEQLDKDSLELSKAIEANDAGLSSHIARAPEFINKNKNTLCKNCKFLQRNVNALIAVGIVSIIVPFSLSAILLLEDLRPQAEAAMEAGFAYLMCSIVIIVATPLFFDWYYFRSK